jgi:uncharacterized membrane-anchored protein
MAPVTNPASKALVALVIMAALSTPSLGQQQPDQGSKVEQIKRLGWRTGPSQGAIANRASIDVPKGFMFLGAADTARFLTLLQNLPTEDSYTLAPLNLSWFVIFDYSDTGYIKDDEKIDADAILQALKEGTERSNEERRKRGFPTFELEGWAVTPHYDEQTKRLEWATRLKAPDSVSVNYKIRLLGRTGVMNATLVSGPQSLDADMRAFKTAMTGFSFNSGERYSEYRVGDKIAEYGLTGLIVGGAAAAAAKFGLFKILGKFAVYIFAAVVAAFGGIFRWLTGRQKSA